MAVQLSPSEDGRSEMLTLENSREQPWSTAAGGEAECLRGLEATDWADFRNDSATSSWSTALGFTERERDAETSPLSSSSHHSWAPFSHASPAAAIKGWSNLETGSVELNAANGKACGNWGLGGGGLGGLGKSGPDWQAFAPHPGEDATGVGSKEQIVESLTHSTTSEEGHDSSKVEVQQRTSRQTLSQGKSTTVFKNCFHSEPLQTFQALQNFQAPSRHDYRPLHVSHDWDQLGLGQLSYSLSSLWRWTPSLHPLTSSGSEGLHSDSVPVSSCSLCQQRLLACLGVSLSELETTQLLPHTVQVPSALGEGEGFDWSCPDQGNRSRSPEVVPNLFRPRKESLVDIDFDHNRAASGLSELSLEEIEQMASEMTDKFNRLSEELIANLQLRDFLVGEMEAKNRFVAALLRVQSLRHTLDLNGASDDVMGRMRQWTRGHRKKEEDSSGMYLQAVIPYKLPKGLKWKTDTLSLLTKLLKAIAEGSNTVPKLMSEYLHSEFLTDSPENGHILEDSLFPVPNHQLQTPSS